MIFNKADITELEIELTTICNAKCPLCYRNYKQFPDKYKKPYIRKLQDIIQQLDSYENLNYIMLVGSMSEPTLYKDFIPLIKYLKNRHIRIEICTNGDTNDDYFWQQLGNELSLEDEVYFTICGSTQEMHSNYRKGTSLINILHNAAVLKSVKPIDFAQCIRFNYNSDDFDSDTFKKIITQFSHIYWTETFYLKDPTNYIEPFEINDFLPNEKKLHKYSTIKKYTEAKFISQNKGTALCQSIKYHRQQIDVFGNVYPCYLFLEYSNLNLWNADYTDIINMQHSCCKFCEKQIVKLCTASKLDYII